MVADIVLGACALGAVAWGVALDHSPGSHRPGGGGAARAAGATGPTDELTGVPNRRHWDEQLPRELGRSLRHDEAVCVAMLDLDWFKEYNDTYGHQAGDRLLKEVAAAWRTVMRPYDLLARYGGEEFSLILMGCELNDATWITERLLDATPGGASCSVGSPNGTATRTRRPWSAVPIRRCMRPSARAATGPSARRATDPLIRRTRTGAGRDPSSRWPHGMPDRMVVRCSRAGRSGRAAALCAVRRGLPVRATVCVSPATRLAGSTAGGDDPGTGPRPGRRRHTRVSRGRWCPCSSSVLDRRSCAAAARAIAKRAPPELLAG